MSWSWRYDISSEQEHSSEQHSSEQHSSEQHSSEFPTQAEAEAWLGESWQQLYDDGIRSVTLTEDGREVYPMSLEPAG